MRLETGVKSTAVALVIFILQVLDHIVVETVINHRVRIKEYVFLIYQARQISHCGFNANGVIITKGGSLLNLLLSKKLWGDQKDRNK